MRDSDPRMSLKTWIGGGVVDHVLIESWIETVGKFSFKGRAKSEGMEDSELRTWIGGYFADDIAADSRRTCTRHADGGGDYLPEELRIEIVSKLSWKERAKARLVCKRWNDYIIREANSISLDLGFPSPGFIVLKYVFKDQLCKGLESWYFDTKSFSLTKIDLPAAVVTESFKVISGHYCVDVGVKRGWRICNMITRKVVALGHCPMPQRWRRVFSRWHFSGLGLDEDDGSYKVIAGFSYCIKVSATTTTTVYLSTYSSSSGLWTFQQFKNMENNATPQTTKAEYLKGRFYLKGYEPDIPGSFNGVMSYDTVDKRWRFIWYPETEGDYDIFMIRPSQGRMFMMKVSSTDWHSNRIWILDGDEWVSFGVIENLWAQVNPTACPMRTALSLNEQGLCLYLIEEKVVLYDIKRNKILATVDCPFPLNREEGEIHRDYDDDRWKEKGRSQELAWKWNITQLLIQWSHCFSHAIIGSRSWIGGLLSRLLGKRQGNAEKFMLNLSPLQPPRFDSGAVLSQDLAMSYVRLVADINDDQRHAIYKILAKDYVLTHGMPETGKNSTMVYAVKALLARGASILLTSYTNSAVDNLQVKLKAQDVNGKTIQIQLKHF